MPGDSLFRREALDAQSTQWLGSIRIARPIGHTVAAVMAIGVVAAIVAFAIYGTYTRRATVPGLLEPVGGTLRLTTPASGTVVAARVVDGQTVAAGDVLFVLSGDRRSMAGSTHGRVGAQFEVRRAMLERDRALAAARHASRQRSTRERLAAIDREMERLDQEIEIAETRIGLARTNVERFEQLARTGFVSPAQVQARFDETLALKAQQAGHRRAAATLARERAGLAGLSGDSALMVESEAAEISRLLAALDQEQAESEARGSTVIVAPHAARVTGIAARVGQGIAAGGLLATLIPEGAPLEAMLYASTRQVGFVATGQRVRLRYAAYPYQKFGFGEGVVTAIEASPYAPQELSSQVVATLGPRSAEPVYRIGVTLDAQTIDTYGRPHPLKPGMVVEADIVQDRRALHEWVLEPLYGMAGR